MSSKRSALLEYLRTTLLPSITVGNGYNFTVKTVERGLRNWEDLSGSQVPAIFITATTETRQNITGNQFQGVLVVELVAFVGNSKTSLGADASGVQLDLDKVIEDIGKALEADRTQGERAHATEIKTISTDGGDLAPMAGCIITVEFQYATEGNAP